MIKKLTIVLSMLIVAGAAQAQQKSKPAKYGRNILRLHPITIFYNGPGFSMSYERIVDKDGFVGVSLPLTLGFDEWGQGRSGNGIGVRPVFMANPGVKFYPTGQRRTSYGVGFSFFAIYANYNYDYYNTSGDKIFGYKKYMDFGISVNNAIQFQITPRITTGMELGLGYSFYNKTERSNYTFQDDVRFRPQFSYNIGIRL